MKKLILFSLLLTSCSLSNTGNYWNNNLDKKILDFDKDYTFKEYEAILKKYNDKKDYPKIN